MRTIDVIGIVQEKTQLTEINLKNGQVKDRRNITICDDSGSGIIVSLWSQNAIKDDYKVGDILAIRGARVSDYSGRSLNSGEEHSKLFVNPDHERTSELEKYKKTKPEGKAEMLTHTTTGSGSQERQDNLKLIQEVLNQVEED